MQAKPERQTAIHDGAYNSDIFQQLSIILSTTQSVKEYVVTIMTLLRVGFWELWLIK